MFSTWACYEPTCIGNHMLFIGNISMQSSQLPTVASFATLHLHQDGNARGLILARPHFYSSIGRRVGFISTCVKLVLCRYNGPVLKPALACQVRT